MHSIKETKAQFLIQLFSFILFLFLFNDCTSKKVTNIEETNLQFENKLVPSIQVISDPKYYNVVDRMNYYNIPGLSISTIKNGAIDVVKNYGFSRKLAKIPVDSTTVFRAGSISKSVTALIVMKLRDKGIISLDNDVTEYLKSWKIPENRFTKEAPVTLRKLLNHTAGIKTFNSKGYLVDERLPSLTDILNGKGKEPSISIDTIPGAVYNYSSRGYSIVQIIIEDVTNDKFENVAKELIFEPLKMTNSTFKTIYPSDKNINHSYSYNKQGIANKGFWNYTPQKAAGGLKTTASDLAKLCIAIRNSLVYRNGFLKMESAKELMEGENYGLGFNLKREKNILSFSHSGRVPGFFAYMILYPETGDGLVLLTNSDNGSGLFQELLRGFSELNSWNILQPRRIKTVEISQELIDKYVGTYQLKLGTDSYEMKISQDGKNIAYKMIGDKKLFPLRALTPTKFIDIIEGEEFEFTDIEGKAQIVISNNEYEFKRKDE